MDTEMRDTILEYIRNEYLDEESGMEVNENTKLISSGLVDSFSLVSLLIFLRQKYKANIPDEEATAEVFDTVPGIMALVEKYRQDR
ncbi:MAG: hypothetical protein ACUVWP_06765 [bacterium]